MDKLMKYLLYIPVLLMLLLSCGGAKHRVAAGEEQDIYEVLRFCFNDSIFGETGFLVDKCGDPAPLSKWDGLYLEEVEGIDTLLTKEDIAYLNMQYSQKPSFVMDSAKLALPIKILPEAKLKEFNETMDNTTSYSGYWKLVLGVFGANHYMKLARPLFTADRKTAIVEYGYYYCCGIKFGEGSRYIIKKSPNGKWRVAKTLMRWH